MDKHKDCFRGFIQVSKAWYGTGIIEDDGLLDSITMGFYDAQGGTTGEFTIDWIKLSGEWTPELKVFEDAFDALYEFSDILKELAKLDGTNPHPNIIADLLISLNVKDRTPRQHK
jgi:hypothetical protein